MPRVRRCRQPNCHAMCLLPSHYCPEHIEHEAGYLARREQYQRSKQQQHRYNTQTRNRNETKKNQYAFYRTRQWVHLREQVLGRDNYVCQYCLANGRVTPAKTVDHIIPIEYDYDLKANVDNLAVICSSCHSLKTKWEQSYYGTGKGNELKNAQEISLIPEIIKRWN